MCENSNKTKTYANSVCCFPLKGFILSQFAVHGSTNEVVVRCQNLNGFNNGRRGQNSS